MDWYRREKRVIRLVPIRQTCRRKPHFEAFFLLTLAIAISGCELIGMRPVEPSAAAQLETHGKGFTARVDRLHIDYTQKKPNYRVDVRIQNESGSEVHVAPERIELALFADSKQSNGPVKPSTGALSGVDLGSPVSGAMGGAQAGGSLGRVAGSGGIGGGALGAGLGFAGALLLMLPIAVAMAVDAAIIEGEKDLDKGETGVYRLVLPSMPIDDGKPYALILDGALGLQRGTMPPLPLVRPDQPHSGYLPPLVASWVFSGRLGGGAIRRAPVTAGLGGFEIFIGKQIGRFSFGGFGTLGAGAWGGEMRLRFDPARVVSLVPFFGYGYYPVVGFLGFNAGHGPRWGMEVQFSLDDNEHLGYPRNTTKVGLYASGGAVFLRDYPGAGFAGQIGLCFGIL